MLGHIIYSVYYGGWWEYNNRRATLFYSSEGGNTESVRVLNQPTLEWELNRAGNITFILPPENDGYDKIECKKGHIFIERNYELIWHGRALQDTFDEVGNREILCEGALNYLLDTSIKPYNSLSVLSDTDRFNELIDEHNRSLRASESVVFGTEEWTKHESNGVINTSNTEISLRATGASGYGLATWSNPSIWQYKNFKNFKIRVTFTLGFNPATSEDFIVYGLHLREKPYLKNAITRVAYIDDDPIYEGKEVDHVFDLGPDGLDGTGHEDCYIGFHVYLNGQAGAYAAITNVKVEAFHEFAEGEEKMFPPKEGARRGINRIPFSDEHLDIIDGSEYPSTLDAINDMFVNPYGGYLFVSYSESEAPRVWHPVINYIYGDAKKDLIGDDLPEIRYGKNLVRCKITNNHTDAPTVLIPIGREKEPWEYAVPAEGIGYYASRMLDKDGNVISAPTAKHTTIEINVKAGEIYFASGQGIDDTCLYAIVNSSNEVLDHKIFNEEESTWYENEEIEIPDGGRKLRIFFYNANQITPVPSSVFSLTKFIESDVQKYITLENFIGNRTDALAGSQYYPIYDMLYIYTHGWVERVVHFENADTQEALFQYAWQYAAKVEQAVTSYEIDAAELAPIVDEHDYKMIGMPGSYAKVIIPKLDVDKKLCVTKCSLNLADFSKTTYSLANLPPPDVGDLLAKGMY